MTKQQVMDQYDEMIARIPDFMKTRDWEKRIYDAREADLARAIDD